MSSTLKPVGLYVGLRIWAIGSYCRALANLFEILRHSAILSNPQLLHYVAKGRKSTALWSQYMIMCLKPFLMASLWSYVCPKVIKTFNLKCMFNTDIIMVIGFKMFTVSHLEESPVLCLLQINTLAFTAIVLAKCVPFLSLLTWKKSSLKTEENYLSSYTKTVVSKTCCCHPVRMKTLRFSWPQYIELKKQGFPAHM